MDESNDDLTLEKTLKINDVMILIRFVFDVADIYYTEIALDECLYQLAE